MKLTRTFTKGIMNKDLDERLIPPGQYRDGQNIGVSTSEDSNVGSIENMLGNTQVGGDLSFLTTAAKTIGAISDDARETFYWFVTDTSFDYILKYNETTGIASKVLEDTKGRVLKFDSEYIITGISIIDNLLFWTDNLNPPRRLNIKNFYALDTFTEDDISVIVKPPLERPSISLQLTGGASSNQQENNIEDKFLRFAYRWRYTNNEYSALSPFSATAFSPTEYKYDYANAELVSMLNQFNQVSIDLNTGGSQVVDIQLVVTNELTSAVYIVETYNKENNNYSDNSTVSVLFNNSKIYNLLAADEVTRLFDNVPLKAQAQTIVGSRLLYGNYVQFFDIVDSFNTPIGIDFNVNMESVDVDSNTPLPTFRSDRDYEVAIAYLDEHGRMTTPLTPTINNSQFSNTLYIPPSNSITSNDLRVTINNRPPVFASKYRIFLKESNQPYDNIFPLFYYVASSKVYFYINRSDVNKVKEGDYIIAKVVGSTATESNNEYKVLEVEVKEKDFLGNNEQEGLYFVISDPNGDFTRGNLFSDSFEGRGLWNGMGQAWGTSAQGYATNNPDRDAIVNRIGQLDVPIFYGKSQTNTSVQLVSGINNTSPYDPIARYADSARWKITITGVDQYKVERMSSTGSGYTQVGLVNLTMSYSSATTHGLVSTHNGAGNVVVGKFYFPDGPGYKIGDSWVVNFHSESPAGFGGSVINPGMEQNEWQGSVLQSDPPTRCREAILPGNLEDSWNLDNDPNSATNSTPNYVDREIKQGSIINITIYEQIISQGFLQGTGSDNLADLVYATAPVSEQQFISSRDYKNIEEWFYEDEIYTVWNHPNAFNNQQQRGANLRVMFKRGLINDASNPAYTNPDFWWQYQLNFANNWTNQMYQSGNTTIPTFGNYPDWASFLAQRAPVRMCIVASNNPNPSNTWNTNPELTNIIASINIAIPEKGNPVFETTPKQNDVDIFYETPFTFNINKTNNTHEGNVSNQSANSGGAPAVISLNTATLNNATTNDVQNAEYNSYCFGNGVESMRIRGDWNGSFLKYSPRASTPIDDYGQERLGASLTYSGIYRENSTVNNLNEFNLSLANFKDVQIEYGPVRKLHARDADVVVFQEDKVSKVLYGKNLLSDSVGGGNIASIPQVLGTQITYVGEYGISENPESFASWGNNMYFTDSKRGAVLQLGINGIFEISQLGMSDYFKDLFRDNFSTQKLGAIDPFKEQYVLSSNATSAPPCDFKITPHTTGRFGSSSSIVTVDVKSTKAWVVELVDTGDGTSWITVNNATPNYSGYGNETVTISVLNNSGVQRQLNFKITGCDNTPIIQPFIQSAQLPLTIDVFGIGSTADANINLNTNSSYTFTNSAVGNIDFNNQKIIQNNQPFLDNVFEDIEGYQAVPKSGDTVTLKAPQTGALNRKSFDPTMGTKMYYLVSNTRYNQSQVDNLLNDSSTVEVTPTLSGGNFEGGFTFNRASNEKYLYLVYDYRSKQTSGNRFIVSAATNNVAGTFNGTMDLGTKVGKCNLNYTPSSATGNIYTIKQGDTVVATTGLTPVTTGGTLSFVKKSSTVTTYDLEIKYYGDGQQFEALVPTPTLTAFNFDTTNESLDPGSALYVCRSSATPPTGTKYHDGPNALPGEGDVIYETPNGGALNLGNSFHRMGTATYPNMNWIFGDENGVVITTGPCTACGETVVPAYTGPATFPVTATSNVNIKLQSTNNPTNYRYNSTCAEYYVEGGSEGGTVTYTPCSGTSQSLVVSIDSSLSLTSSVAPTVVSGTVTVVSVGKSSKAILPPGLFFDQKTGIITGTVSFSGSFAVNLTPENCFGQGSAFTITFVAIDQGIRSFEMDGTKIGTTSALACAIPSGQLNNTLFYYNGNGSLPVVGNKVFINDKVLGIKPFNGGYQYYNVPWGGTNGSAVLIDARGYITEITTCP